MTSARAAAHSFGSIILDVGPTRVAMSREVSEDCSRISIRRKVIINGISGSHAVISNLKHC